MPAEKHKSRHSEHSLQEPSQDEKSIKKHKKKKLGMEKKRKRKDEGDELVQVQKSPAPRGDVIGDVITAENAGKNIKETNDGAEGTRLEDVNEPSLPAVEETRKKKKKKKKKAMAAEDRANEAIGEKQLTPKPELAEAVAKKDLEDVEPARESESPKAGGKRKKKKKNRKGANHSEEGDGEKKNVVDNETRDAEKKPQSENIFISQGGPAVEPHTNEETLKKDLADGTNVAEPRQDETSLLNTTKKHGKKRKRGEQGLDHPYQHPVKDSDRKHQEAKGENSATKRLKHGRSEAESPVNAQDIESESVVGDETLLSKSKSETPSGAPSKETPQEPSGDQEDAEAPLDDKRLPRTLFVGNVPHTADRKEIRKIFAKYGAIESVRIRNVIPDNPKIPKKAALLAKRLASFSNSFSAYVVFKEVPDINKVLQSAVKGTNMTIFQDHHLRVTRALQTKGKRRLSIFVGNLPFDCSDEELIKTFMPIAKECGVNLLNVRVTRDKDTGVGRGVGFVVFDDMMAIQACMNKAGEITLRGRVLRMERAFKEKMMKSKTFKRKKKAAMRRKK